MQNSWALDLKSYHDAVITWWWGSSPREKPSLWTSHTFSEPYHACSAAICSSDFTWREKYNDNVVLIHHSTHSLHNHFMHKTCHLHDFQMIFTAEALKFFFLMLISIWIGYLFLKIRSRTSIELPVTKLQRVRRWQLHWASLWRGASCHLNFTPPQPEWTQILKTIKY